MATNGPITWDDDGKRLFELGVDRGVLYVWDSTKNTGGAYGNAVPWNGLTAVTETPSGADETALWADNIKYGSLRAAEEFSVTIEAYTYPVEFEECDGSASPKDLPGVVLGQQKRKMFGFSFRSLVGNDTDGTDYAYKLHLIYGLTASPSERAYSTVNDSPDAITFSWECSSNPTRVAYDDGDGVGGDFKPVCCITINSHDNTGEAKHMADIEEVLYGKDGTPGRLPLPAEVLKILKNGNSEAA